MAAGSFLSEYSAVEYVEHREVSSRRALTAGVVMFCSYFLSGFIPLAPYVLASVSAAVWYSITASLISLLLLEIISARLSDVGIFRNAIRMFIVGGIAIAVGVTVGQLISSKI